MAKKPETIILERIEKWLNNRDGHYLKLHGSVYQRRGEADLIGGIVWKGKTIHFVVEVKIPGEKPTPFQFYRMKAWHDIGFTTGFVTSVDDMIDILDQAVMGTSYED